MSEAAQTDVSALLAKLAVFEAQKNEKSAANHRRIVKWKDSLTPEQYVEYRRVTNRRYQDKKKADKALAKCLKTSEA